MNSKWVIGAGMALLCLVLGGTAARAAQGPATTRSVTNAAAIQMPEDGPASLYPSSVTVSGMAGVITRVTATIRNFSHPFPDDVDILLVGPGGKKVILMSDAGGSFPISDGHITFADGSPLIPNSAQIVTGSYGPTNWGLTADVFSAPAPAGPYLTGLTNFNGLDANGVWQLFVYDDALDSIGSISGGWYLTVTAAEMLPELSIAQQGQTIHISWPASSNGYVLEHRPELSTGPPSWTSVTNEVSTGNGRNQVTIPLNGSSDFFRLMK